MILALHLKNSFILDRNLAKANCTENRVCTSCDIIVLGLTLLLSVNVNYYVFHGRVTLFFANNSLTQCRITMKFLHNFFQTMKYF